MSRCTGCGRRRWLNVHGYCRRCATGECPRCRPRRRGLAALLLALAACAGAPTPGGISADLGRRLDSLADWPLPVRCQEVRDAAARCLAAGLPARCYADGWHDRARAALAAPEAP